MTAHTRELTVHLERMLNASLRDLLRSISSEIEREVEIFCEDLKVFVWKTNTVLGKEEQ